MTAIGDHCNTIRSWLNIDYSDTLITSWTRMAEEYLSEVLRCKHMIAIDTATVSVSRVILPTDWQALDFVRLVDGGPLKFVSRDEFYSSPNSKKYTITGNHIVIGGDVDDGVGVEISYYESVPALDNEPTWMSKYYSGLYVASTLVAACSYGIEDDRATMWETRVARMVDSINEKHAESKSSGSTIAIRRIRKGFG